MHCLGAYWDPGRRPTSIATALHRFKYGGDRAVGHALQWLARSYAAPPDASGYDLVVPVPLTRAKLRSRGLNQAAWIARAIARTLFLPTVPAALARIRDRRAQIGLAGSARRSQAGSEFRAAPAAVSDRRVLLIDDVITTGTTLANCARELRRAGASGVVGVTLLGVAHYHGGDDDEAPD